MGETKRLGCGGGVPKGRNCLSDMVPLLRKQWDGKSKPKQGTGEQWVAVGDITTPSDCTLPCPQPSVRCFVLPLVQEAEAGQAEEKWCSGPEFQTQEPWGDGESVCRSVAAISLFKGACSFFPFFFLPFLPLLSVLSFQKQKQKTEHYEF